MSPLLWLALGAAGGLGAICRYTVDARVSVVTTARELAQPAASRGRPALPLGTITVNTSACLLLSLLTGWGGAAGAPQWLHAVVGTGFLGGYSTFSTACLESARLLREGRGAAQLLHALAMTAGTLVAAAVGLVLGASLG